LIGRILETDDPLAATDPTLYYGGFWIWQTFICAIFCTWYGWLPIIGKSARGINGQPLKWGCCVNRRFLPSHSHHSRIAPTTATAALAAAAAVSGPLVNDSSSIPTWSPSQVHHTITIKQSPVSQRYIHVTTATSTPTNGGSGGSGGGAQLSKSPPRSHTSSRIGVAPSQLPATMLPPSSPLPSST
jgi:hypothetical protein